MADPSRKMANRSGNAQLGILPSGGSPPDLCKAERRLSFQWVGLCKRCESSLLMRPWWPPAPSYAPKYTHGEGAGRKARGIVGSKRASRRREMSRPRERWPIALAMRNGEYYLTVVAAPIDRRRIRRPPSSPSFLGLAAIDALYPKRCPKHGKAFASMLAS
jgi:hypothetical protein